MPASGGPPPDSLIATIYLLLSPAKCATPLIAGMDVFDARYHTFATLETVGFSTRTRPTGHYGHLPTPAKWVRSFCMVAGRLEFYTMLVILTPAFWRR